MHRCSRLRPGSVGIVKGRVTLLIAFEEIVYPHRFYLVDGLKFHSLIGKDFLYKHDADEDFLCGVLCLDKNGVDVQVAMLSSPNNYHVQDDSAEERD